MRLDGRIVSLLLFLFISLNLYPDSADNLYKTAVGAVKEGFYLTAANSLEKFIKYYPGDSRTGSAYYLFALSNYYLQHYRIAIDNFSALIKKYPGTKYKSSVYYWMGLSYFHLADYRNSILNFNRQIKQYGANKNYFIRALYYKASSLERLNKNSEALLTYKSVIGNGENPVILAASIFAAGSLEFKDENYNEAFDYFKKILIGYPDSPYGRESLFFSAECSFFLKSYAEAEERYTRFLQLYPSGRYSEAVYYRLAYIYVTVKDTEKGLLYIEKYEAGYPEGNYIADLRKLKARAYFDSGDFKLSRTLYRKILKIVPDGPERQKIMYNLGVCSLNIGDKRSALKYFRESSTGRDSDTAKMGLYKEGQVLIASGHQEEAAEVLKRFIRMYPEDASVFEAEKQLGDIYDNTGKYKEALAVWNSLVNSTEAGMPADSLLYKRGSDYIRVGDYTKAIRDFGRIINHYGTSGFKNESLYQLGYIYSLKGEYRRSLEYFEPLLNLKGDLNLKEKAAFAAAAVYFDIGDYVNAEKYFLSLTDKVSKGSLEGAAALNLGRIKYKQQEYSDAYHYFIKANSLLAGSGDRAEAVYWAGWSRFRTGDFDSAKKLYLEVVKDYPESGYAARAYYRAGISAFRLKEYGASIKYYNASLSADRGNNTGNLKEVALAARGISEFYSGKKDNALKTLKKLSKEFPGSSLAAEGYYRIAEYLFNKQLYNDAYRYFSDVVINFPDSKDSELALYWQGNCAMKLKDYREAVNILFNYLSKYPRGVYSNEAGELIKDAMVKLNDNRFADSLYKKILGSVEMPESVRSKLLLEYAVYKFPADRNLAYTIFMKLHGMNLDNRVKEKLDYWIGRYYRAEGKLDRAAEIFRGIADTHTDRLGAEAQLELAGSLKENNKPERAAEEYLALSYVFPDYKDIVAEALYRAARIYETAGNKKQAGYLYKKLRNDYPDSAWIKEINN